MSLDLLSGFPTSKNGYDCIVAFTKRLSKRDFISPCHKTSSAKDLALIFFFKTVFRQQDMSHILVSVEPDGNDWYQIEQILDHRGKPGPHGACLVR
jgi:hypothetical protein